MKLGLRKQFGDENTYSQLRLKGLETITVGILKELYFHKNNIQQI